MKAKKKKRERSEGSQFEICSNDEKDSLCDENDVNPASSQWRWRDFFLSRFSLGELMLETDLGGGTKSPTTRSYLFLDFFEGPSLHWGIC